MGSIGLYPIVTIALESFYITNRDSILASLSAFDTFRIYQEAFNKEAILSFCLLHLLIVILSLLPDFTIIVANSIHDAFQLFRYEYKDTIDFNMRFGDNIQKRPSPGSNCKLQRFQQSTTSPNGSPGNLGINSRPGLTFTDKNVLRNTKTNSYELVVSQKQTSYDNPSYEK